MFIGIAPGACRTGRATVTRQRDTRKDPLPVVAAGPT